VCEYRAGELHSESAKMGGEGAFGRWRKKGERRVKEGEVVFWDIVQVWTGADLDCTS